MNQRRFNQIQKVAAIKKQQWEKQGRQEKQAKVFNYIIASNELLESI